MNYPIAQLFHSLQGEGVWTGAQQYFVRLAGCNVGVYTPEGDTRIGTELNQLRVLNPRHSVCTSIFGTKFLCDTDYHMFTRKTEQQLVADCSENMLCLTGGEPFLHDVIPLVREACRAGKKVHIETSGTLPIPVEVGLNCWITCSPKLGYRSYNAEFIDEFKFVVDVTQNLAETRRLIDSLTSAKPTAEIFIQPVNAIESIDDENLRYVRDVVLRVRPKWRLSLQTHKLLGIE